MNSVLAPGGLQASRIAGLYHGFFWLACVVWVLVALALGVAIARKRTTSEARLRGAVTAAVTATAVTVIVLVVMSALTGRALASYTPDGAVTIHVVGRQRWWEYEYESDDPTRRFITANEMHVPVGKPVLLRLEGRDVIHSFWVPSLNGKRDLIPGKNTTLFLEADQAGEYEGQCAEFCGLQHANMRFVVVAESPETFAAWEALQRTPAKEPTEARAQKGERVFLEHHCSLCHSVRGTEVRATAGPDLTHVGGRHAIGARTVTNTREHLAGWIRNPNRDKPGALMPPSPFAPDDLDALSAYLEGLE